MKKIFLSVCTLWIIGITVNAQVNVGSTTAPNGDAMLQITSSNKGLLLPNISLTATNAASPLSSFVAGMTVYNTATAGTTPNNVTPGYYYSDGTQWIKIASSSSGANIYNSDGTLTGNRTVTMGTNNLVFNGTGGNVGVNNTSPTSSISINGSLAAKYNGGSSTSAITLAATDYFYNWSGGVTTTINLPVGTSGTCNCSGRMYIIKNNSATATANLTVTPNGSETIDGKTSFTVAPQQTLQLINTGAASGSTWTVLNATYAGTTTPGATVFVGGSLYCKFGTGSGGTISNSNLINGGTGTYSVGSVTKTVSAGALTGISGNGFLVSNPSSGIYDIQFTSPFNTIFGVSVNILDDYGSSGGQVGTGTTPDNTQPGTRLSTTDNTQIAYLGNGIIEIKTGDNGGILGGRSFAFVVSGK